MNEVQDWIKLIEGDGMKNNETIESIVDVIEKFKFDDTDYNEVNPWITAAEILELCQPQWISVIEYIAETQGRVFLLDKGYKPALEKLVLELGYAEDHHGNRLLVRLPEPPA